MGLITETAGASVVLSDEAAMRIDDVVSSSVRELAKLITRDLHERGYPVPELTRNDMVISQVTDPARMTTTLTARYSPDPRRGIKFSGGPMDGAVETLTTNEAPAVITMPGLPQSPTLDMNTDAQPMPSVAHDYLRAGIDPIEGIWVYEYRKTR